MAIYLKNIDLSKNQLQNATLHPTGTAPTTSAAGQVYFDTSAAPTKGLYVHDGSVWTPLRIGDGVGITLDNGTPASPTYDIDFTSAGLGTPVTTNTAADIFAMYDDSVSGMRAITFGNLESNLTIANMIGGGTVGTVTSVGSGNGLTGGPITVSGSLDVGAGTGITVNANDVALDYLGTNNFIDSATNLEGTAISTGDTIVYHDATDNNVKKGFVSDLPFTNTAGTVTEVTVGTGLDVTSATTIPDVTLSLDELSEKTGALIATDRIIAVSAAGGFHYAESISQIPLSIFSNDANWSSTTGTVTSITAGNGMDFTTITGTGPVTMGTPSTIDGASTNSTSATSHTHELDIESADLTDSSTLVYNDQANTYTAGKQTFIASTTGAASIRLQTGVNPTTPVQGDVWMQSDNLRYRDSSASRTIVYSGGAFHNGFSDYIGNEHIDHDNVTITVSQTANETSVTGAGQKITGNVTFTVGLADNAVMPGTGGMIPVAGTTGQRVATTGNFRYNTTDNIVEWYNGTGWARPDTGGGEQNQDAFSIVTGDSGTASADAVSDTIAITGATGLKTVATAGASAALEVDYDIPNVGAVTSVGGDFILLGDASASQGIAKTTITNFISNNGIALLASPAFTGNPTAPTPTQGDNDTSIATTAFVTTAVQAATTSIDYKESSRVASTANISVTYSATGGASGRGQITAAPDTVDGISLAVGNRILLKDQSTGAQNGIWAVTTVGTGSNGVWDRATDFDEDAEVTNGAYTFISEGTVNEASGWRLSNPDPIVIGGNSSPTALVFDQVSGAGQITAGDGLTKTGNILDVNPGTGIAISTDQVVIDTAWSGQSAITIVGDLDSGSIGANFDAIIDARLATITTANKVSGSAVQLAATSAIENSTGLRLKSTLAGDHLSMTNQVLDVAESDTTTLGVIERATVTESQTATATTQAVTPAGLGDYVRSFYKESDAGATTTVTHGLGHRRVQVEVYRTLTPWDTVYPDVTRPTDNTVLVTFTPAATSTEYTIVVTGAANASTVSA